MLGRFSLPVRNEAYRTFVWFIIGLMLLVSSGWILRFGFVVVSYVPFKEKKLEPAAGALAIGGGRPLPKPTMTPVYK